MNDKTMKELARLVKVLDSSNYCIGDIQVLTNMGDDITHKLDRLIKIVKRELLA